MDVNQAANAVQWQLARIKFHLEQAEQTLRSISQMDNGGEVLQALDEHHNRDGSIGHCLRWGLQAATELLEEVTEKQSGKDLAYGAIEKLSLGNARSLLETWVEDVDRYDDDELRSELARCFENGTIPGEAIIAAQS